MSEYQKIPGPFLRQTEGPNRNKLIRGAWSCPEFRMLADADWEFTEKVDGTNVRVQWDGHRPLYLGRTDNAQMPTKLIRVLAEMLPEEMLEQVFGANPATLYGEGYGAGIQRGGVYRPDMSFVLFDVKVPKAGGGHWWLQRESVLDIGTKLGIDVVPEVYQGTLTDAINCVRNAGEGTRSFWNPDLVSEGWVGRTAAGLLNRAAERIIVKLKSKDLVAMP